MAAAATLLHTAVEKHDYGLALVLLRRGADVNSANSSGRTPLDIAVRNDDMYMARLLLDNGADIPAADLYPNSLLHTAVEKCDSNLVRLLLRRGADVNSANSSGRTPLDIAVRNDDMDMATLLLDNGADIPAADLHLDTLLHTAVEKCDSNLVRVLLRRGVDVNSVNSSGLTPLAIAVKKKNWSLAEYLLLNNADHTVGDDACDLIFISFTNNADMDTLLSFQNIFRLLIKLSVLFCETKLTHLAMDVSVGNFLIECRKEKKKLENYSLFCYKGVALELLHKTTENEIFDFFYSNVPFFTYYASIHDVPFLQNPGQYVAVFENSFNIYGKMFTKKFSLGVVRYYWLNLAVMILQHSSSTELPFHVWLKICKGVNTYDMKNLVLYYREQFKLKT